MKNSLKQLLRTPMKTCLFFLLMTAATALLVMGANLWAQTQAKIDAAEGLFVTLHRLPIRPRRLARWRRRLTFDRMRLQRARS